MMIRPAVIFLAFTVPFLTACTTAAPPPFEGERPQRGMSVAGLDLTLPAGWWHETHVVEPLALTGEQFQRLDALQPKQADVARLERDAMVAARELRTSLDARNATAADIVAAGAHLRSLQQALLEQQIETIAAQREILTLEQWQTLQGELAEERRPQRRGDDRGRGPGGGGGRGGRGGGRRPPSW